VIFIYQFIFLSIAYVICKYANAIYYLQNYGIFQYIAKIAT